MPFRVTALFLAVSAALPHAQADILEPIRVEDTLIVNPMVAEPDDEIRQPAVSSDGADFLRQINGVSVSRFGGRGLEPIIHGQSQTRLNVLLDGAYVHGGCPNRMDPPTSWAVLGTYEKVTVLKGVQTLIYGGGGSGGTVLFERDTRALAEEDGLHGRVEALASDNTIRSNLLGDVVMASDVAYLRLFAETKDATNYEDGDGRELRSSFDHQQAGMVIGFTPKDRDLIELTAEHSEFEDTLYPGASMDSPEKKGDIFRFRFEKRVAKNWLEKMKFESYLSDIDHLMDNYSNRPVPTYPAGMGMAGQPMKRATPTTSKTTGGRLLLHSRVATTRIDWGLDLQRRKRNAELYNLDGPTPKLLTFMWPDVSIEQTGLFAEATAPLAGDGKIKYGLRLDRVEAKAARYREKPAMLAPQSAYQSYYGVTSQSTDETNIGALLRYEKQLSDGRTYFAGLSRSLRTADATERYINKWSSDPAKRWIGNPALDPEQHHQIDMGIAQAGERWSASGSIFYDDVTDFILRDTARGQDGILRTDLADVYRNIDAVLYGIEAESRWRLGDELVLSTALAWVHGTNVSDDRPLPQIPPLSGKLQLDYDQRDWGLGARIRFADRQDRIDLYSRQEVGETAGWAVLDLYGNLVIGESLHLRAGIDNVGDKIYAEHASRANLLEPQAIRVNEPGRTVWLKLTAMF